MTTDLKRQKPAPFCQLQEPGTQQTYEIFLDAMTSMQGKDIDGLSNELDFFEKTGLVGVRMSRLLARLNPEAMDAVA